ncbi:MAG TPA: metallophosphoesterase family protein [Ktedonobacteraceae bacterium]|nr:metallophosphoesterase family protein [Ktedonobacteraceae bacterium]
MRIAILADIHGNETALQAVLEDLAQQPPIDQIVIAGDLCLNGPDPKEVLTTIQELPATVVQGNVDADVAQHNEKNGLKKQSVAAWTREQIGSEGIAYLAALPHAYTVANPEGSDLLVVHANPLNQEDAILPNLSESKLEQLLGDLPPTIGALAFGHYHVAYQRRWRHLLLVDAGSCGLPRDGDPRASYAILTWQDGTWQAEHRRVRYNLKAVAKRLKNCGIPNADKRVKVLTEAKY